MMNFLRKHMQTIFLITIFGFVAGGAFAGLGSYFFGSKSVSDAVAEINGKKIPYKRYLTLYKRTIENLRNKEDDKVEITDELLNKKKQEVMQDLIQEEVFWQEAKKYGISVSDTELSADIRHYPAFQREGRFDQWAYFQVLNSVLRTTPKEFEESRRRQIAIYKLRQLIASSVKISDPELRLEYARANKGNMKDFEENKSSFLDKLRQEKIMLVYNEWFKKLNQTVKIRVFLENFEQI